MIKVVIFMAYYLDIPYTFPGGVVKHFDLIVPPNYRNDISTLLVWVHGGGWNSGDKRIQNEFHRFCYRGYPMLAIEYRLSRNAPYPAQLIDCKSAIRWARAHAAEYGIKADRIIVGGGSAGGHLSAMLGLTSNTRKYDVGENLEYSSAVDAVVDFCGPADLTGELLFRKYGSSLLSNDPELAKEASPLQFVAPDAPPFLICHGDEDPSVPLSDSRRLRDALTAVGVPVTYFEIPGAQHGFDHETVYRLLTEFITKHAI